MRKTKLLKRICVFATTIGVSAQLLLYPIIPVTAGTNDNLTSITDNESQVAQQHDRAETQTSEVSYGYYDTGYNAPILSEPEYFGLNQAIKLPSAYSSRTEGYVTDVKNQGSLGTCWAFGPIAAMESYALRHGLVDKPADIDLSEYALASLTFDDSSFTSSTGTAANDKTVTEYIKNCMLNGGNDQYVFKTLTKWAGIMDESDYQYIWSGTEESIFDESKVSYILTNQYFINMNNTWHVKNAIMENGAVVGHYNADDEYDADFYKNYHYTYKQVGTNHAIAIVGWDDSIAASNFTIVDENGQEQTPDGPGAWLIKNSWGTYYGDGGYMWVSYYDKSITDTTCAVFQIAPKDTYDYNYQHDGATIFGYNYDFEASSYANVFKVVGKDKQAIKAVSFAVEDVGREYSIQVYKNPVTDNPESGTSMLTSPVTGIALYAGYYTVNLPQMMELNSGDSFSIVITFDQETHLTSGYNGDTYVGGGGYATATCVSEDNQSYLKKGNTFVDMYEIYGSSYKVNFCIKAMVVDYDEQIEASTITSIEKNGDSGFVISWQAVKNGITYELLRATELDGEYDTIYSGANTSHVDTSVDKYTRYYYKVRVYDGQTTMDSVARSAYIGVPATQITDIATLRAGLMLEWKNVSGVDGYRVYRSLDGVDYELMDSVKDKNSYIDEDVEYGERYYYVVKAYVNVTDTSGIRVEEAIDSIPVSVVRDIESPLGIYAYTTEEYGKIEIEWDSAGDVDGYILYRSYFDSEDNYVEMEEITTVAGNIWTYVADITDIPPGQNVYFYVRAYMNVAGGRFESDYVYDYLYLGYAPVKNIKWYVNSNGVMNVKWDEYSAEGITVTGYTSIIYNDLAGSSIANSVATTTTSFAKASLDPAKNYYLYVQAKNAMQTAFTPKQSPLIKIGGAWGEFAFSNIPDVSSSVGETVTLEAKLTYELENFDYKYQWYKTDSKDGAGSGVAIAGATSPIYKVLVEDYGNSYYYCVCTGEYNGMKTTISNAVTVSAFKNMADVLVSSIGEQTYTGGAITPSVIVKDGSVTLVNGTDYTLSYSNNVNVGTATVTITGKGNYSGSKSVTFAIVSKSISGVTVSSIVNKTYSGSAITPVVIVKDGTTALVNGTDYTVSYSNNVKVGTATVTITGKGNYSGSKGVTFAIVSKSISGVTVSSIVNQTYTGAAITPTVTVKDGNVTLVNGTDYSVSYSNNVKVGTATVTISGKGNYSGSKSVTFAIVSKSISGVTVAGIGNQTYIGSAITPSVTVKDGSITLVNGTDYSVSYSNNVKVGTATVTISGKGNYSGSKSVTFVIVSKSISGVTVSSIVNQIYSGSAITPTVTVKDGSITLVNGADYTVNYSNNVKVGTATVTITGKGNYSGSKSVTFAIVSKNINGVTVSSIVNQTYNGSSITPIVTVKDGTTTLVNGTDYSVSYSNNVNVGTATLTITGKGNYSGSKSVIFAIVSKSISGVTVSSIANQTYTGGSITPSVTVKDGSTTLVNGTDYTLSCSNNVKVGTATLTITGKGNYSGSKNVTFTIVGKEPETPKPEVKVPDKLTSSSISINQTTMKVSKIKAGTTVSGLLSSIDQKHYAQVYSGTAVVSGDKLVGTGMKLCIVDKGKILKTYTIIVTGDTNGDGKINITDMIAVKAHILKKSILSGVYANAGDVNGDGKINITDFIKIKANLLGKDTILGVSIN